MGTSELLTMDGYDDCLIGIVEQFGRPPIACYDKTAVIAKMVAEGASELDAEEFFDYNQLGSYLGEQTPCFITLKD